MVVSTKKIWVIFLTLIASYSVKIPFLNAPIYRVIFPLLAISLLLSKNNQIKKQKLMQKSGQITWICWAVIIIWGSFLAVAHNTVSYSVDYLMWDVCFVCVFFCYSIYFARDDFAKTCLGTFFAFSAAIGLSGIYESATGRLYHETHVAYRAYKNALGLVRPNTIFFNVNDSAVFMSMALILAFLFAEYCNNGNRIKIIALVIFGGNVLLTESRGAIVGVMLFIYIYFMHTLAPKKKFVYVLAAIPILVSFVPFLWELVYTSDVNFSELGGRGTVWRNSLSSLIHSNFLGNGPGNTVIFNSAYTGVAAVHNWFLEIICDYGLIGGISLFIWYIKLIIISHGFCKKKGKKTHSMIVVYAGLIGFIFLSISSSSLIGKIWPICFFGILIAEINKTERLNSFGMPFIIKLLFC